MRSRLVLLILFFLSGSVIHSGELFPDLEDDLIPRQTPGEKTVVAEIDGRQISLQEVLTIWLPAWRNLMARCQAGSLDEAGADAALQASWESTIAAMIRNEIFYREANLYIAEQINIRTEKLGSEASYGPAGESSAPNQYLHAQVKASVYRQIEEEVARNIHSYTRQAGGKSQLLAVLAANGSTWQKWREQIRRNVMIAIYQSESLPLPDKSEFSPAEIRAYYKRHADEFRSPAIVHFRHIFIAYNRHGGEAGARKLAGKIIARLKKNEISFAAAIKEFSDDAPSVAGGGLDPLPEGLTDTPEALAPARLAWLAKVRDAAAVIPTGKISPLLLSDAGCHLIQVLSQEEGELLPFSEAQEKIAEILAARKRQKQVEALYQKLRARARVQVLIPNYPAKYRWSEVRRDPALRRSIGLEAGGGG